MTTPSSQRVEAALEAIRSDAQLWSDAADQLSKMVITVQALRLEAVDFSYIGDKVGLTDLYKRIQDKVTALTGEGMKNFESLSRALHECADEYERADDRGRHELGKIQERMPS